MMVNSFISFLLLALSCLWQGVYSFVPSARQSDRCMLKKVSKLSETVSPEINTETVVSPTQESYDALLDWLRLSGAVVNEAIEICPSSLGVGYGVKLTANVKKDEVLFTIPRNACFTLEDATSDPDCGKAFERLIEKAGQGANTVVMAAQMSLQYLQIQYDMDTAKTTQNKWAPYFQTLPWKRNINNQEHVLFWSNEMVESLVKGSASYDEAVALRQEVDLAIKVTTGIVGNKLQKYRREEEESTFWPWQSKAPSVPPPGLSEAVKGAFVCLLTRAFQDGDEGDEEKLVPLLDLLQHSNEPNIRHQMLKAGGTVEVRARRNIEAGEELLNQYRSEQDDTMPYSRFWSRFGFVPGITEPIENLFEDKSTIFFPQSKEV